MGFSDSLKRELKVRGWTPTRLAAEIEERFGGPVWPQTIQNWVNGNNEPTVSRARDVADVLGVSLDDLTTREPVAVSAE